MRDGESMTNSTFTAAGAPGTRGRSRSPHSMRWGATSALALVLALATLAGLPVSAAQAAPSDVLTLDVASARTEPRAFGGAGVSEGDPITDYKFLINENTIGGTEVRTPTGACTPTGGDTSYPDNCTWTSLNAAPDATPIVAQGDQVDLAGGMTLPDGDYLISILADGYKLDGAYFSIPLPDESAVPVGLQPFPLPDSTVRGLVFKDVAPTNGAFDNGDVLLAGFEGHLFDTLGEISTDVYGNPLCTTYFNEDPDTYEIPDWALVDGVPVVDQIGGVCRSDSGGIVTYPHMGTNRYTQSVSPPDGETWIQTTTLEGNHDWDTWVMEGSTGYDTEFAVAGEAVPMPLFGFAAPVKNGQPLGGGTGSISGRVMRTVHYVPPKGGEFDLFNGYTGSRTQRPIPDAWISLAGLEVGDQAVWVGQAGPQGNFTIDNVPDGNYQITWWDEAQNHLIALQNVTVAGGEPVDMGVLPVSGWWTEYTGKVFNDKNRNGKRDAGEPGVPNFPLTMRKRDNTLMDRGQTAAVTDANGNYSFEGAYPLGEFGYTVMEAYSDSFYTTGVTWQADNMTTPKRIKGAGVDLSTLNIIGLGATVDWGVHSYDPTGTNGLDPQNGGIVGSVSYDTTRNEFDPTYAASEDWQPGIPNIPVMLYATVDCTDATTQTCDADERLQLDTDGSYLKGDLINSALSESWEVPTGCDAVDVDGNPLVHGVDEDHLALNQEDDGKCIPAFSQSVQVGAYPTDQGTPDANFGAAVNGNYGFGDACTGTLDASDPSAPVCNGGRFEPLVAGDYLVSLEIPQDDAAGTGNPLYKPTGEEDINIGNGNEIVPQVPPPSCAGPLHTVDVKGIDAQGRLADDPDFGGDGPNAVDNPTFLDIGGSPYEGTDKPTCETKLVGLNNGKSIVPMFNLFTDVPLPSRLRGLIIDDINFSGDKRNTAYGEKSPGQFLPIGIYDWSNRLVTTVESDFNGFYDVLLPSTNQINCPTPSGICAGMYRFVGNDPGVPGALNPNYNPRFRVISTEFEAVPGVTIPTDLAPTQVGAQVRGPVTGQLTAVTCPVDNAVPQLFAVSKPYVNGGGDFVIEGSGFGATKGTGSVSLDGTALPTTSWSDTSISVTVPSGTAVGPHQLLITGDNGNVTRNGLTFHVIGGSGNSGYNPNVLEVGTENPANGTTFFDTIQGALNRARTQNSNNGYLVVVYPGTPDLNNPRVNPLGAYYENLVMASPVKLQGVGPGGFQGNDYVAGTILDASGFGGDTQLSTDWYSLVGSLSWDGNQTVNDGQGIYVLASQGGGGGGGNARQFTSGFKGSIDGFDIRGGDQRGFPGNINEVTGLPTGLPANITTQGGAIMANAYARYLQITNNVVQNNGGGYGAIRLGTPDLTGADANQHNENVRISHNRIINNAGTNLAGALGLFGGSDNYEIDNNDVCGNFTLEYGGGISVYGRSPGGRIHHNAIYLNQANDEGGGIMIAGALPANPDDLSPGSGSVSIDHNQIKANMSNDDGGGIRFLMAGNDEMNVNDNVIADNVSTHEGGGIALNDASNVRIVNNTIMKNLTTSTAVTSNGAPAPAGLSTSVNSDLLRAAFPSAGEFSNPVLFNNIFWDNRSGTRAGNTVTGLGLGGPLDIETWDLGVADPTNGTQLLAPTYSIVEADNGGHPWTTDGTNSAADPNVVDPIDVSVSFAAWRQNPAFVDATLVAVDAPVSQLGDYHLNASSPAVDTGTPSVGSVSAPGTDIDDGVRPFGAGYDIGSHEFGSSPPAPPAPGVNFHFSTLGNVNVQGVGGAGGTSGDVYRFNGTAFSRTADISTLGIPNNANVDGLAMVDDTHFYVSFTATVVLPGSLPVAQRTVLDNDIAYYDGSTWSVWFRGATEGGLPAGSLGSFTINGQTLFVTMKTSTVPPGAGGTASLSDIYQWDRELSTYTRVVDTSAAPYNLSQTLVVDGLSYVDATHFKVSFSNNGDLTVPGLPVQQDEDVLAFDGTLWSTWFDGTPNTRLGTNNNADIDALSLGNEAGTPPAPPTADPLVFSTVGNVSPDGVITEPDDADVYGWSGTAFSRSVDATSIGVLAGADVDGLDYVDATHFYVSFNANTRLPGLGAVQDEDVVYYNNGTWELFFDGTAAGLTRAAQDVDAIMVVNANLLLFSTVGNVKPPGVGGGADNSDIYQWTRGNGNFTRHWDATTRGVPSAVNVDGFVRTGNNAATYQYYLSFSNDTVTLPGIGTQQDEDVVRVVGNSWSVYFDGTAHGLGGNPDLDVDAFDIP